MPHGRRVQTTEPAFVRDDQDLPIWSSSGDGMGLVHQAEMRAPRHFMNRRYFDFDAHIVIEPPRV